MSNRNAMSGEDLSKRIQELRELREVHKSAHRRPRQRSLTKVQRNRILEKTGGRCHICGGKIKGAWNADHILAHSRGGKHSVDNYLPAHGTCNHYRWDYLPEEFELILKLGVWTRTEIQRGSGVGRQIQDKFSKREARRLARHVARS